MSQFSTEGCSVVEIDPRTGLTPVVNPTAAFKVLITKDLNKLIYSFIRPVGKDCCAETYFRRNYVAPRSFTTCEIKDVLDTAIKDYDLATFVKLSMLSTAVDGLQYFGGPHQCFGCLESLCEKPHKKSPKTRKVNNTTIVRIFNKVIEYQSWEIAKYILSVCPRATIRYFYRYVGFSAFDEDQQKCAAELIGHTKYLGTTQNSKTLIKKLINLDLSDIFYSIDFPNTVIDDVCTNYDFGFGKHLWSAEFKLENYPETRDKLCSEVIYNRYFECVGLFKLVKSDWERILRSLGCCNNVELLEKSIDIYWHFIREDLESRLDDLNNLNKDPRMYMAIERNLAGDALDVMRSNTQEQRWMPWVQ